MRGSCVPLAALAFGLLMGAPPARAEDITKPLPVDEHTVAKYAFDEESGTAFADLSGNGLAGSIVGNPVLGAASRPGSGRAIEFPGSSSGSSDFAAVPDSPLFDIPVGTIECFVKLDALVGVQGIFARDASGQGQPGHLLVLVNPDGSVGSRLQNTAQSIEITAAPGLIVPGVWHHLACLFGGPRGLELYVDGVLRASSTAITTGIDGNDEPWVFGVRSWSSNTGSPTPVDGVAHMDGLLDDLRISDVRRKYVGVGVDREPSIEEMLATTEAKLPQKTPAGARRPGPAGRKPDGAGPPEGVGKILETVKARAQILANSYAKYEKMWSICWIYMKFDNHKKAARVFPEMTRRKNFNTEKSPVPQASRLDRRDKNLCLDRRDSSRHLDRHGFFEVMCARTLIHLGEQEAAKKLLAQAETKLEFAAPAAWSYRHFTSIRRRAEKLMEAYPAANEDHEALVASIAEEPTAEKYWELAGLCSPLADRADRPFEWLKAMLVLVSQYPGHPKVLDGTAYWDLFKAYRLFDMHDKCVEVLGLLMEKCPKHWNVMRGRALWEIAESHVLLGLLLEEVGDRSAGESYRAAVRTFSLFERTFPKDGRNLPRKTAPPLVFERRGYVLRAIARL